MTAPDRYGKRNVPKMIREWDAHRQACRAEGTPAIQATLDAMEEHIDYAYRATPAHAAMTPDVAKLVEAAQEYIDELEWHYGGGATDLTRKYRAALAALRAGGDAHGGKDG